MRYDYIIVGSGIAGLYAALLARGHGSCLVLTKGSIEECNTRFAQGGIAAAVGPDDSPELHLQDTIDAGAGLVDSEAARILTGEARERIRDLVRYGVPFDTVGGEAALAREAAHSRARILHSGGDSTGAQIEVTLSGLARLSGIAIKEHCQVEDIAVEDGRAVAVLTLDSRTNSRETFEGCNVILATGGCGRLFRLTTNSDVATGDGVALAYRAGAETTDMEFIQFHPTALRLPGAPVFLISEALRGEGAVLRDASGRRFMLDYHPQAELAPRDVVARAMLQEMLRSNADHVFLDITHLPAERVSSRFPQIYRYCLNHGLDITSDLVPVSPAAHYMMGGVRTDVCGRTNIAGLYACGEVACTGVHGANRLASNSLLETVVFSHRAIEDTVRQGEGRSQAPVHDAVPLPARASSGAERPDRPALQALMWRQVGMVRNGEGLADACKRLAGWERALPPANDRPSHETVNMVQVARLIAEAALIREESRGAHYRTDFPEPRDEWRRHIVFRRDA